MARLLARLLPVFPTTALAAVAALGCGGSDPQDIRSAFVAAVDGGGEGGTGGGEGGGAGGGTGGPSGGPLPDGGVLKASCDLPALKSLVEARCVICHGNGATVGNYSVDGEWQAASAAAVLGVKLMLDGTMPPPGLPALTEAELAVVRECKPERPLDLTALDSKSSVATVCPSDIPDVPGFTRTRLLSKIELTNTLEAIVGQARMGALSSALGLIPGGDTTNAFSSQTGAATSVQVEAMATLGEAVGGLFATTRPLRVERVPCLADLPASPSANCRGDSLRALAQAFFRRPATAGELADLESIWQAGADTAGRLDLAVRYLSQAPEFIYLVYEGTPLADDPKTFELTGYELAQRLSYWLTKAPPDAALLAKAADGTLVDPAVLRAEVLRLLADPKALAATRGFAREWLGLDFMSPFPTDAGYLAGVSTDGLADEMRDEIEHLVETTLHGGGSYSDLMLSRQAKVTPRLAGLYGLGGASTSAPVALDAASRAGLLTRAALHVRGIKSSPYHMAKTVYERVIACDKLAPPPAGATTAVDGLEDKPMSYRHRFESVTLQPMCVGCHNLLNAPAFAFQYDAIGRFAETEVLRDKAGNAGSSAPIDRLVSAYVTRASEAVRIDGPVEMSRFVAGSERAQRCFLTQSLRAGDGRSERLEEGCSVERARRIGSGSLKDQLAAYLTSKAFRQFKLAD